MRVEPDRLFSAQERSELARITRAVLAQAGLAVSLQEAAHPAVAETAHTAQRLMRRPVGDRPGADDSGHPTVLARMLAQAKAEIAGPAPTPQQTATFAWPVDPARPAPHLQRSLSRALRSLPPSGTGARRTSALVEWRAHDTAVLRDAVELLAASWPEMHAELGEVLVQIALLEGPAIDGFTDFAVHGAVFVRRERLHPADPQSLPGSVRLAEALVHEGAHTRCNAAIATGAPFLHPAEGDGPLLATPLRADPRPLAGLFQQMVVLARSTRLYRRLLEREATALAPAQAVRKRHDDLANSARQAARALASHRAALTERGRGIVDEAAALCRAGV